VNESNFPLNGFLQVNNTAQNIISFTIQTIEFVLREVVLVILRVALPLSLALFLFGLLLYFTHLNRRMGRDFIVLSLILILISQLIQL
jgi:hypothetical protein